MAALARLIDRRRRLVLALTVAFVVVAGEEQLLLGPEEPEQIRL
jgi:Zn-dependent M28 family amino/carboxypeptidase